VLVTVSTGAADVVFSLNSCVANGWDLAFCCDAKGGDVMDFSVELVMLLVLSDPAGRISFDSVADVAI